MKNLIKLFTVAFLFLAFVGCSKEEEAPSNVITDAEGVNITLEWTTGGTVSEAQNEADLDLYISTSTATSDAIQSSTSISNFEDVQLVANAANDTYYVIVKYFSGSVRADYTVYVQGATGGTTRSYEGFFLAEDSGLTTDVIEITKDGENYTIID